jgi:DHA1 family tetracycline resistance protein-like MFS transporter
VSQTIKRSTFSVLFTTVFLDFLGFALVLPFIFFYAESFGASPFIFGLLLASYSISQFIFTPIWGSLSDRFGRRKIMLLCLLGSGLSFILFGLSNSLWLLFLSRIIAGAMGATFPVASAYVADITTPENRMKYMGKIGAAFGLGFIIGPAIGGTLSGLYGFAVPSLVAAALALANFALGYFRLPETIKKNEKTTGKTNGRRRRRESMVTTFRTVAAKTDMKILLATYFIAMLAFFVLDGTGTPWSQQVFGFGPFQVGLLFFYIGLVSAVVQGLIIPKLSRKYSPQLLLLVGVSSITIGLAMLGAITSYNLPALIISSSFIPLGMGFSIASINTLVSLRASADRQGSALGVTQSVSGIAQIIGPAFGASIFGYGVSVGLNGLPFIIAAAIALPAIAMSMGFLKRASAVVKDEEPVNRGAFQGGGI